MEGKHPIRKIDPDKDEHAGGKDQLVDGCALINTPDPPIILILPGPGKRAQRGSYDAPLDGLYQAAHIQRQCIDPYEPHTILDKGADDDRPEIRGDIEQHRPAPYQTHLRNDLLIEFLRYPAGMKSKMQLTLHHQVYQ